jgi:hypothetical protein
VYDHPPEGVEVPVDGGVLVVPDDGHPGMMSWTAECPVHGWLDAPRQWSLVTEAVRRARETGKVQHVALSRPNDWNSGQVWHRKSAPSNEVS